ncbi:MAG: helix-turn-helix domain-containing protein [Brevundimonas sp.]|uniref:helix-turn-helix domain-containing protein n=1 Tax=Brevundimonas sp. TaxID=1871086 RepID=UPI00121033F4|nr:helix-turn-helix domain-containing protein [Brevundimonas sp.]RZJ19110.1 MAG: helix-turn-helix domain-containing protein [Brevundimonas sp.]
MSDVAVTWAKAQECRDAKGNRDRNAKDVLKTIAAWADAEGEVWAAVPVLALECDVSERTVQRGLRALKGMGLLIETGAKKTYMGRLYPIYRMPLDTGHASTIRRLKAERAAAARGDAGVTPRDGGGVTRVSPQDDTGVTPPGDTGVTQIGKEIPQEVKPLAGAREREAAIWAWAAKAPERVSPRQVERAWLAAMERSAMTPERLLSAVRAAVARDPDFARDRAMNLDRWLDEDRFEVWLPDDDALAQAPVAAGWSGPRQVRDVVVSAMGDAGAASYLNPARWDETRRVVQAATSVAATRLIDGAGRALKAIGVSVEHAGPAVRHG